MHRELVPDDLVVDEVGGTELAKVEARRLFDELVSRRGQYEENEEREEGGRTLMSHVEVNGSAKLIRMTLGRYIAVQ